jgi:hypothetical protein
MALTSQSFIDIPQGTDILSDIAKSTVQGFRERIFRGCGGLNRINGLKTEPFKKNTHPSMGTKLHH